MNTRTPLLYTVLCAVCALPLVSYADRNQNTNGYSDLRNESGHSSGKSQEKAGKHKKGKKSKEGKKGKSQKSNHHRAIDLTILHTNDHHSYLEGQTFDLNLDYDPSLAGTEAVRLDLGGFARIASEVASLRDDNTLVLNSGELNGTLYFSLFKGEVDIKVFNEVGLDAYELGNHEFDEGESRLAQLISMANFPVVAANVHPTSASPLYGSDIRPYVIKEIEGEQVAVIGVLKVEKTVESSLVTDAVEFSEEITTVRDTVAELKRKKINKIIVLSHLGYEFDQQLAAEVNDVDAIIGGDTHNLLDSTGEMAGMGLPVSGEYPTVTNNPNGEPVYIVQAWQYARGLGILRLSFNKAGRITSAQGYTELLVGGPYQVNQLGSWAPATTDQVSRISLAIEGLETIKEVAPSPVVEAIIAPYKAELVAFQAQQLGEVVKLLPFTRIPTAFAAGETPTGSYAAHIVADAFLKYLPNVDIAIQNSGGVRTAFTDGVFTVADAYTMLPFSNTVVTIDMSGQDIINVLEEAVDYALGSGSTGAFPYASHLRYDIVKSAAFGSRVLNTEVMERVSGIWLSIDPAAQYKVATNSFTALGKDGYDTFARVTDANPEALVESDVVYVVPLIEYFTEELIGGLLPPLNVSEYSLKSVTE